MTAPLNIDALQGSIGALAAEKWPKKNLLIAQIVLGEEVGELGRAIAKRHEGIRGSHQEWTEKLQEEAGDVLLALLDIAHREGFSLWTAALARFSVIADRDVNHHPLGTQDG